VAGRLVDLPGTEVGPDLDSRQQMPVGLDDRIDPGLGVAAARLPVALQGLGGDAALAGDLDPVLERRRRVVGHRPHVLPGRVHPELAAGRLDDRRRQPIVVGMGMGADEQPYVLDSEADLSEREVELAHAALAADAGVEEDDAAVGGDCPDVAVRHAGPGQRQPQPPDAGQHLFAARRLRPLALAHLLHPLRTGRTAA